MAQKPSIPKGTRDFSPTEMAKRNFIFDTVKSVFKLYGFQQIETPAMENLSTLMGKYGEEGDKLLFKILNSGDFFRELSDREKDNKIIKEELESLFLNVKKEESFISFFDRFNILDVKNDILKKVLNSLNKNEDCDSFVSQSISCFDEEEVNAQINKVGLFQRKIDIENNLKLIYSEKNVFKAIKENFNIWQNEKINNIALKSFLNQNSEQIFLALIIRKDFKSFWKYFEQYRLNQIDHLLNKESKKVLLKISEKGLRYDLTVPFARYVVQYQNDITFPFRRYQIQPVWRADRPQKGRYREFYQCDVDIIGSDSLLNEVELVQIVDAIYRNLGINVVLKINNRKILAGIAGTIGEADRIVDITVAIDKLDKIGLEKVNEELLQKGVSQDAIVKLQPILQLSGNNEEKLNQIEKVIGQSGIGMKGVAEMRTIFGYLDKMHLDTEIELDLTLARGLNYYTGAIFEVKSKDVQIGSITGGGRYDDLTGIFGLPGVSGVGISFGADRIYDVMSQLDLFPQEAIATTQVMFVNFGEKEEQYCLPLLSRLRAAGISSEIFPDAGKMKKQMIYANRKGVKFVVLAGESEIDKGMINLKNMETGDQQLIKTEDLVEALMR